MIYMNKCIVNTALPVKNGDVTRVTTYTSGVYDRHDPCEASNEIEILQYIIQSIVIAVFSEYRDVTGIKYYHNDIW